jgi:16S rRNA (cytidine1402-2'-O)-methyltransferase
MTSPSAVLFVVATPIGNLSDISERALGILKSVSTIAAEDTRETRKLLSHFQITGKKILSYHDYNEEVQAKNLIEMMISQNLSLALVSDAGTPCIADPGYRIVAEAHRRQVPVHPIPGPSALVALVSASGLPSDRFSFVGFLPTKKTELNAELESWSMLPGSIVFYESTRRLEVSLSLIAAMYPQSIVSIGRELTKLHEEVVQLPIADAVVWIQSHATLKGEVAVMLYKPLTEEKTAMTPDDLVKEAGREFRRGATLRDLLKAYSDLGFSKSELYALLLEAKNSAPS